MGRKAIVVVALWLALVACSRSPAPPPPSPSPSSSASTAAPTPSPTISVDTLAPPGFVDLSNVDPSILLDIRYAGDHNFVGRPIEGYLEPRCLLTSQAAQALAQAQRQAMAEGFTLKVYDCYRPVRAGVDFETWARDPTDDAMRGEFFPSLTKADLFAQGFVGGGHTTHSGGSTVDLTLVPLPPPNQRPFVKGEPLVPCTSPDRFPDNTVDMGTGFDCFDPLSHTLDPRITGAARENRLRLRRIMTNAGFVNYSNEWWHYDFVNDPHPNTYYDFPVARAALT